MTGILITTTMLSALPYVLIIFFAFSGFLISFYVWHKKRKEEVLVCPLNADCETVIHSQFSKFFGIPVEYLGLLYYALIALSYGALILFPAPPSVFEFFLFTATTGAFLFSLYLTFIQAFTIKQWCSWCLASASLSTGIFILAVVGATSGIFNFLEANRELLIVGHTIGFILGLGGAMITDILFMRFLRDFRISEKEADVMSTTSQVIWFGLAIVIVTGLGLYLPLMDNYHESTKFLAKMVVVAVVAVNGAFLNLFVEPRLVTICFNAKEQAITPEMVRFRRLAFALGAVSFVSWWSAFVLGSFRSLPLTVLQILLIYIVLLAIAVASSQVIVRYIARKAQ